MLVNPGFLLRLVGGAVSSTISEIILHITGSDGLVVDAADGTLENGTTSAKTITDFDGLVKETLANEIRFLGGRRVEALTYAAFATPLADPSNIPGASGVSVVYANDETTAITTNDTGGNMPFNTGFFEDSTLFVAGDSYNVTLEVKNNPAADTQDTSVTLYAGGVSYEHTLTDDYKVIAVQVPAKSNGNDEVMYLTLAGTSGSTRGVIARKLFIEKTTGQTSVLPSSFLHPETEYNAGIDGVAYFDTENGNTVSANIVTEITGVLISPAPVILHEPSETNLRIYSNDAASQSGNCPAVRDHAGLLSIKDTGDRLDPSGTYQYVGQNIVGGISFTTGSIAAGKWYVHKDSTATSCTMHFKYNNDSTNQLAFNPVTGALLSAPLGNYSITDGGDVWIVVLGTEASDGTSSYVEARFYASTASITGDVVLLQSEAYADISVEHVEAIQPIFTTSTAVTTSADSIKIPLVDGSNWNQDKGVSLIRFIPRHDSDTTSNSIFSIFDGLGLISDSATINTLSLTDGTNTTNRSLTWVAGDDLLVSTIHNDAESSMSINVSTDAGSTWSGWVDATYDGAFVTGTDINLFYSNAFINELTALLVYSAMQGGTTIAEAKTWVEANAGTLTTALVFSFNFAQSMNSAYTGII